MSGRWTIGGPRITAEEREEIIEAWFAHSPEVASRLAQSFGMHEMYAYKLVHSRGLLPHKSEKRNASFVHQSD